MSRTAQASTENMPRLLVLSVVIPTYDTAAMTLGCVRAVLASADASTEVLVVDDGSRDGTAELLARETPDARVLRLESNRGFAVAANHGVAAARGAIVLLLNSDALVERGALRAFVAAFDRDRRLGIAGARLRNDDGSPQWSGGRTPTLAWMLAVVSGLGPLVSRVRTRKSIDPPAVDWVSGAAMAFRAEVWRDAGPLAEHYRFYCQDLEFCLRARANGWDVRIAGDAHVRHGLGKTISGTRAHDPERLWPDLLTWGRAQYGRGWAAIARPLLCAAAALRVAAHLLRADLAGANVLARAARRLIQSDS